MLNKMQTKRKDNIIKKTLRIVLKRFKKKR